MQLLPALSSTAQSRPLSSCARHFTRLNLDVTSLDEAGLCSFVRACSQLDELDVMSFHDAILAGACMDVALAGNRTLTKYGCRGYMPATLPCSLQHIRVELGDDTGASEAAQLLIRLWQCPKLQTISFEAHRCSEAPLELSKKRLYHLALLPSLQSFRLTIHAKTGSFVDVSWLQLPRSFAVQLEYDEGGWDGSVDWEGTPSPIEEIRGHWLHEAAQLQPQDSFKASFTVFAALSPADRQALSQLRPARCRLTLPPQLLSVLPRCRVVDLCFGFCREDKVPATTGQAELTWAALTASPVRINVSFERWARPQLRVTGCPPDSDAPSFAEPWLLCVRGSCLLEGLPPGARAEQDCYLLQNAAARKAGL